MPPSRLSVGGVHHERREVSRVDELQCLVPWTERQRQSAPVQAAQPPRKSGAILGQALVRDGLRMTPGRTIRACIEALSPAAAALYAPISRLRLLNWYADADALGLSTSYSGISSLKSASPAPLTLFLMSVEACVSAPVRGDAVSMTAINPSGAARNALFRVLMWSREMASMAITRPT